MEAILAGEPLIAYLPAFQRTGFTDLEFLLAEDPDAWQMMLDVVADDLAAHDPAATLKPGHRLMIMSRLRKAKIEREREPDESRQRRTSPSPGALRQAWSSRRDAAADPEQQQMSACATFLDGFRPLWNVPVAWRLALVAAVLSLSLVLWAMYEAADAQVVGVEVAGAWLFVKVLYIAGFVVSGLFAALAALDALRQRRHQQELDGEVRVLPTWNDCCPGPGFAGRDQVRCPALCDPMIIDCSTLYKIACCRCSIQIE